MSANRQFESHNAPDPIVEELHRIREELAQKYGGDLNKYSEAARAHALALGFQFLTTGGVAPSAADGA